MTLLDQVATSVPFRWADFAVAASIFIAGVFTLLPAIQRSRERMNQAGCVFNLQQLGNSLAQYASLHPMPILPYPPDERSDAHAGMFAAILHDAGVLNDMTLLGLPVQRALPSHQARARQLRSGRSNPPRQPRLYRRHALLGLRLQRWLPSRVVRSCGASGGRQRVGDTRPGGLA